MQNRFPCSQNRLIQIALFFLISTSFPSHAQTYLINDNFNDETTVFSLHPSADTLAWKFSKHGGVSSTSCLVSEMVTNSGGTHPEEYYASKSLSLTAGNTYQVTFKSRAQTTGKRKAMLGYNTSADRDGSTLIEDFGSITSTEEFTTYSTTFSIPFTGTYYLIYYAVDLDAPSHCLWYTDDFKVQLVNTPPTASLTGPANSSVYNPEAAVSLTATTTDAESNVTKVEFYADNLKVGEDDTPTSGVYSLNWVPENGGSIVLKARAVDSYGASAYSSTRTITVLLKPEVNLTNPGNEAELLEGPLDLTATATDADGTINRVVFYADGDSIGVDYTSPYQLSWIAPPSGETDRTYLKAKAVDNHGLTGIMEIWAHITANSCTLTTPNSEWKQSLCAGDSLMLISEASTGAETVRWLRNDGTGWEPVPDATDFRFWVKEAGWYVAEWTFSNLAVCTTGVDTVVVNNLSVSLDTAITNMGSLAKVKVHVSGGLAPYVYSWDPSPERCLRIQCDSVEVLPYGPSPIVTVTDYEGCFQSRAVNIIEIPFCQEIDKSIAAYSCSNDLYGYIVPPMVQLELGSRNIISNYLSDSVAFSKLPSVIFIPTVFGVIDSIGGTAISDSATDSKLKANLDVVNRAFGKHFLEAFGMKKTIQFCLATRHPATGDSFTGIIRVQSTTLHKDSNASRVKNWSVRTKYALADFEADRFLRIIVFNKYNASNAGRPTDAISYCHDFRYPADAIWLQHTAIGDSSNKKVYDQGMALTHEIGHWLGLNHTYQMRQNSDQDYFGTMITAETGDSLFTLPSGASGTGGTSTWDFVRDTPPQAKWSSIANSFRQMYYNSSQDCLQWLNISKKDVYTFSSHLHDYAPEDTLITFTNIMDNAPDFCRTSFTKGQVQRYFSSLLSYRRNLHSPENLAFTGAQSYNYYPVASFQTNYKSLCGTDSVFRLIIAGNPALDSAKYLLKVIRKKDRQMVDSSLIAMGSSSQKIKSFNNSIFSQTGLYSLELTVKNFESDSIYTSHFTQEVFYASSCPTLDSTKRNFYFGQYAGVCFGAKNQLKPDSTAYHSTPLIRRQRSMGGNVTVNDSSGNLVFCASERGLWYKNHVRKFNQVYSDSRSAQYGVSVWTGIPGTYALYTVPSKAGAYYMKGLRYHRFSDNGTTIDSGGTALWNQPVKKRRSNSAIGNDSCILVSDKITAIPKCGRDGDWLLVQKPWATSGADSFYAYSLDSGKIKTIPKVYSAKVRSKTGFLKTDNNGGWLVSTNNDTINANTGFGTGYSTWVFQFGVEVGGIAPYAKLAISGLGEDSASAYGAAFSPNSKLVYVAVNTAKKDTASGKPLAGIYQFPLDSVKSQVITGVKIGNIPPNTSPSLDIGLGADGKLYLSNPPNEQQQVRSRHWPNPPFNKTLGVIHFPNDMYNPGLSWDGPSIAQSVTDTLKSGKSLPNFVNAKVHYAPDTGLTAATARDMGNNPGGSCPVRSYIDVACTGNDEGQDTTGNDIFYTFKAVRANPSLDFQQLGVSTVLSDFMTVPTLEYQNTGGGFTKINATDTVGNGRYWILNPSMIEGDYFYNGTEARFKLKVEAKSPSASGSFRVSFLYRLPWENEYPYGLDEGTPSGCRQAVDGEFGPNPELPPKHNKGQTLARAAKSPLRVFPNPSSGIFNLSGLSSDRVRIMVYDLTGKKVAEPIFSGNRQIDLNSLPKGIYHLKVSEANRLTNFRIVIQ